jgi:hypothetical protein
MLKTIMLAAAAVVIAAPVLAQESKMILGEGESVFISPDGTLHKSNTGFPMRTTRPPLQGAPMNSPTARCFIGMRESSTAVKRPSLVV